MRSIDPNISDKKTLYEYVDNESVEALKTQAQQEMKNLKVTPTGKNM